MEKFTWNATSSEFNNKGFQLQVALKTSGTPVWKDVAFIAGAGNTTSKQKYNYTDQPTGGNRYLYRIKQVSLDNNLSFSDIKKKCSWVRMIMVSTRIILILQIIQLSSNTSCLRMEMFLLFCTTM